MGAIAKCGQCVLVLVNILFSIIGLALFVVGLIVRYGTNVMDQYLSDFYASLQSALEKTGAKIDLSEFNLGEFIGDAAVAFIVIGVFFLVIGIIGCCGACCKIKFLLVVYAIVVLLIFLAELVFVILLFAARDQVTTWLKEPMLETIHDKYTGSNGTDVITLGWNFIMVNFECCGVDNYTDFLNSTKWNRYYNYNGIEAVKKLPLTCCKHNTSNTVTVADYLECVQSPTTQNANIKKGCFQSVEDFLVDNSDIMIAVGVVVAVLEILLIVSAFCICASERKKDDKYDDY